MRRRRFEKRSVRLLHDAGPCSRLLRDFSSLRACLVNPLCYQGLICKTWGVFLSGGGLGGGELMWRRRRCGDGVEVEENYSSESFSCEEACTRTMLGNPDFFLGLSISRCHCHHCHENMARLADHDRVLKHRNTKLIKTSVFADFSVDRKATRNPIAAAKQTRRKRRSTAREINNLSDRVSRSTGHDLGFIPVRNLTDL
jgi:hypothetical protein